MANSIQQQNNRGRSKGSKDKNGREMHPNSLKNLRPNPEWKPGHQGRHKGMTITQRQQQMMSEICPFDSQGRTWLEAEAEGGMRMALSTPVALNNLQDRIEGKVTQPIGGDPDMPLVATFVFVMPDGTKKTASELVHDKS